MSIASVLITVELLYPRDPCITSAKLYARSPNITDIRSAYTYLVYVLNKTELVAIVDTTVEDVRRLFPGWVAVPPI